MATYPSYPLMDGTVEETVDDLVIDRAVNGNVKVRAMYPARKRLFRLRHDLAVSELYTSYGGSAANALMTFYNTNRTLAVTFTWTLDGQSYTCLFARPPRLTFRNARVDVEVELVQQ